MDVWIIRAENVTRSFLNCPPLKLTLKQCECKELYICDRQEIQWGKEKGWKKEMRNRCMYCRMNHQENRVKFISTLTMIQINENPAHSREKEYSFELLHRAFHRVLPAHPLYPVILLPFFHALTRFHFLLAPWFHLVSRQQPRFQCSYHRHLSCHALSLCWADLGFLLKPGRWIINSYWSVSIINAEVKIMQLRIIIPNKTSFRLNWTKLEFHWRKWRMIHVGLWAVWMDTQGNVVDIPLPLFPGKGREITSNYL